MGRTSSLWLLLAFAGLACTPKPETYGPPDNTTTVTSTSTAGSGGSTATSTGGGGATTTSSGGAGGTGGTTASGGAGGDTGGSGGICMENMPYPAEGTTAPGTSKCHCKEEAAALLPTLALAAKDYHDQNNGVGCGSALAVPAFVPSATYYVPYKNVGLDFDTGDSTHGWLCLNVPMPEIVHCKYTFTKGSDPVTSQAGGPSINKPEGFEVTAQGDADGDGVLATFSIVGNIDANGDLVLVAPFENNPNE